jgi:tetraacyldisaccharide 4'-kinase
MSKPELEAYLLAVIRGEKKGFSAAVIRLFLAGLELVYRLLLIANAIMQRPKRLPVPVISVGNITVGGTGKTPTVVWLARILIASGKRPAVLTRGYGGTFQKEGRIFSSATLGGLTPGQTGDEPYLLASILPETLIVVGRDRYSMALQALKDHPEIDLFLLDDGFQYRGLRRELDIVLIDAANPFDNRHLIPRGLLREPLAALKRAGIVLLTRAGRVGPEELAQIAAMIRSRNGTALIAAAKSRNTTVVALREWGSGGERNVPASEFLTGRRVGVVTAIGNPGQLAQSVSGLGAEIAYFRAYPDHYAWTLGEIVQLLDALESKNVGTLLVTAKDAVKLRTFVAIMQQNNMECYVLGLDFEVEDPAVLAEIKIRMDFERRKAEGGRRKPRKNRDDM